MPIKSPQEPSAAVVRIAREIAGKPPSCSIAGEMQSLSPSK
jgi:hypothetical protein